MDEQIQQLIEKYKDQFECDFIEIKYEYGSFWMYMCFNRNTRDDPGYATDGNGNIIPDWDYVQRNVMASGKTVEQFERSILCYKRMIDFGTITPENFHLWVEVWEEMKRE